MEDQEMKGWTEIKMMFTGGDRKALQTLIDNDTITEADQQTPRLALKAIQTAIKDGEHYWHYRDEVLSDIRQQPEEQCSYNISQCLSHTDLHTSRCHHKTLQPQLMLQMWVQPRQQGLPRKRTEML